MTILKSAEARKQSTIYEKSKYRAVLESLPSAPTGVDGYHRRCYSAFTAVQGTTSTKKTVDDQQPCSSKDLRSRAPSPVPTAKSRLGSFENKCLYCNKQWKTLSDGTKEGLGSVQTKDAESRIVEAARLLVDNAVLVKISGIDLIAKEVKFHHSCRRKKLTAASRVKSSKDLNRPIAEKQAVTQIFDYVKSHVIQDSRPERLKSVYDRYCLLCEEVEEDATIGSCQYLGEMLKKRFPNELAILLLMLRSKVRLFITAFLTTSQ